MVIQCTKWSVRPPKHLSQRELKLLKVLGGLFN